LTEDDESLLSGARSVSGGNHDGPPEEDFFTLGESHGVLDPVLVGVSGVPIEPDRFPQPPGEIGLHGMYITSIYR